MVSGPSYEAPSEAKLLKMLGCDAVGMSTVPEIVTAHHSGMKCIGLSLVTNKVKLPGDAEGEHANHAEVLECANMRAEQMQALVKQIVSNMKADLEALPELPKVDLGKPKKATKAPSKGGKAKKAPKAKG